MGRITDQWGRKPGILAGLTLALGGTLLVGFSMSWGSLGLRGWCGCTTLQNHQ
jgi:MFS family permease